MENLKFNLLDNGFDTALKNAAPFPFDKYPEYKYPNIDTKGNNRTLLVFYNSWLISCWGSLFLF